jgi:hypothetical protein
MLTGPEHVCLPGKTGSDRRAVKVAPHFGRSVRNVVFQFL